MFTNKIKQIIINLLLINFVCCTEYSESLVTKIDNQPVINNQSMISKESEFIFIKEKDTKKEYIINYINNNYSLPLYKEIKEIKDLLSKKDTNFDIQNSSKNTILHIASKELRFDLVERLIEYKINVNIKNNLSQTALNYVLNYVLLKEKGKIINEYKLKYSSALKNVNNLFKIVYLLVKEGTKLSLIKDQSKTSHKLLLNMIQSDCFTNSEGFKNLINLLKKKNIAIKLVKYCKKEQKKFGFLS